MKIREEIHKLREEIRYHNDLYYNKDNPEISDYEYDNLLSKLKELEEKYPEHMEETSPTNVIGGSAKREAGILVKHNIPMLSLEDVFGENEVYNFINKIKKDREDTKFVVERKIDGLSVSLRYRDGIFVQGITRGDGINYGEDVTENLMVISDLVKKLKDPIPYIELRGEVYIKNKNFNAANDRAELEGKKPFANPRNFAAGTIRQLDSKVVKERKLSLFIFNVQEVEGINFTTHSESFAWLKRQGFKIIEDYKICNTKEEVWDEISKIGDNRGNFDYDIDGAVIKVDSLEDREYFGATAKAPRWAIAYKYPPEEKETIITDIRLTIGRSGRITPTAIFNPIRLCGTNVEKATLHNQDRINELDVRIGDTIVVRKAGEIIPEVVLVNMKKRPKNTKKFIIPNHCPVCGAPTVKELDSADTRCTGLNCPAQLSRHIINFVSRNAMDIKGFGVAYVEALINEGYIKDIADIYYLKEHRDELIEKGLIGKEKNTDKLLKIIEDSKGNDIDRLITGFGIRNIGRQVALSLKNNFDDIEKLKEAKFEELIEIDDIGEISAKAIVDFFEDKDNLNTLDKFKKAGVNFKAHRKEEIGNKLENLVFVVTGTMPSLKRSEVEELVKNNGGKVSSSVSKKTSYVIAGENAGSKLDKAHQLGIEILSQDEFLNMI